MEVGSSPTLDRSVSDLLASTPLRLGAKRRWRDALWDDLACFWDDLAFQRCQNSGAGSSANLCELGNDLGKRYALWDDLTCFWEDLGCTWDDFTCFWEDLAFQRCHNSGVLGQSAADEMHLGMIFLRGLSHPRVISKSSQSHPKVWVDLGS